MRQIDKDWEKLFETHHILDAISRDGFFVITSKQINEVHEARLMTKFDNRENLPDIFRQRHFSILPVSRGSYVIGEYDAYQDVNYEKLKNIEFSMPSHIESININDLYSESACLNCAYTAGIIDDICGGHALPTVSGRMSSSSFDFKIKGSQKESYREISVVNSQVEIDGGYESEDLLLLVEAKNYSVNDFLVRQLYYPYRLWSSKISKRVVPAFFTFSNDIFSFFIYEFENRELYNSIHIVSQRNYIFRQEPITLDDIYDVFRSTKTSPEPHVPFPQCDNFYRIIDLLGLLVDKTELTLENLTNDYAFTSKDKFTDRQTTYYTDGAMYIDLVEKVRNDSNEIVFRLTNLGKAIMAKRHKEKCLSIVGQILKHEVFYKVLEKYFSESAPVSRQEIFKIMKDSYIWHVESEKTKDRRAQSVKKWIEWILDLQEQE